MKYTIITGAASDIGKEICLKLANNGHALLMLDIDGQSMEEVKSALPNEDIHHYLVLDFSEIASTEECLKKYIIDNSLEIKSAVFAAGIFSIKPLRMLNNEYFIKSMNISVFSVIQIMQIVTSKKINKGDFESAVVISSISSKIGTKGYALYSTIKSSLLGLVHSLAVELSPSVRINAILPGSIKTKATAFIYNSSENANERSLLGEGTPKDIANLIHFLISDESRWITGQEFVIDGGTMIS